MEWPFIAMLIAIAVLAIIATAALKSRWAHRGIIKEAKRAAQVEVAREEALKVAREKIADPVTDHVPAPDYSG